jgi:hypothetical protein
MIRTVTIDIINEKALALLKDLESLKLIRLRKEKKLPTLSSSHWIRYKGAMSKQSISEIDKQLNDLRNEWG